MKAHYIKRSGMVLFLMLLVSFSFSQPKPELFQQMKARSIGPAGMSGCIADIEALASNPDVIYVGSATGGLWRSSNGGTTWGENPERGIYKTTDGGTTWEKILFINEKTGCADLIMDPQNPDKLFAAMWQHRRWPWFFESGGSGSGLYRTTIPRA